MPTRRSFILGGTVIAAAAVAASKPADRGGPYSEYFARLNRTLRAHGIDRPVLVIDLDRLVAKGLRLVAQLLDQCLAGLRLDQRVHRVEALEGVLAVEDARLVDLVVLAPVRVEHPPAEVTVDRGSADQHRVLEPA